VLKVTPDSDGKGGKVSLGMKASYFEDSSDSEEEEEEEGDSDGESEGEVAGAASSGSDSQASSGASSDEEEEGSADESGDEEEDAFVSSEGSDSDEEGSDSDDEDADMDLTSLMPAAGKAKSAGNVFAVDGESSDGSGSDSEEDAAARKAANKRLKKAKESEALAAEAAVERGEASLGSVDDFERLVLANPHSSAAWIRYMAFMLSRTEIDGARKVARRALKTIRFRDEEDKMNVWVALLNLEHKYGTADTLSAVLQEALEMNNPKHVHLHMLDIYERAGEGGEAHALLQLMTRKYASSKKVWLRQLAHLMKSGDAADTKAARATLKKALRALGRHKHVFIIQQFALLEYRYGNAERGRTVFEDLLSSYPKRLDLWNVYIDQEVSAGQVDGARRVLQNLTGRKFSSKKMRFLFKKWLALETQYGEEEDVEAVKAAARAYVESQTMAKTEDA
jgi:rRNA biogenesis protein RRP5